MKNLIISILFLVLFLSCGTKQEVQQNTHAPQYQTPAALQENTGLSSYSKRGQGNLVEELYAELSEKDSNLSALNLATQQIHGSKNDSLQPFYSFNGKNSRYYRDAGLKITGLRDTVLRDKIKAMLRSSLEKYDMKKQKLTQLEKIIDSNDISISDLHLALKISRTIPVIEEYQKTALPSSQPLEKFVKKQEQIKKELKAATGQKNF